MSAGQFTGKPRTELDHYSAAQYHAADSDLSDLLEVAQKASEAAVVAVPEWGVVLVRSRIYPDNGPSFVAYKVVHDGEWLVYSHRSDGLYAQKDERFWREHQRAGAS